MWRYTGVPCAWGVSGRLGVCGGDALDVSGSTKALYLTFLHVTFQLRSISTDESYLKSQ